MHVVDSSKYSRRHLHNQSWYVIGRRYHTHIYAWRKYSNSTRMRALRFIEAIIPQQKNTPKYVWNRLMCSELRNGQADAFVFDLASRSQECDPKESSDGFG